MQNKFMGLCSWMIYAYRIESCHSSWFKWLTLVLGLLFISGCQASKTIPIHQSSLETVEIKPGKTVWLTYSPTPFLSRISALTETQEPSSAMLSLTETPTQTAKLMPLPEGIEAAINCQVHGLPEVACTGVATNDDWTPLSREFNGIEMVLVPAGCFLMGSEEGFAEEQPVHKICIDSPFWIDLTEVTVAQFANFLNGQVVPIDDYSIWLDVWTVAGDPHFQLTQRDGHWFPLMDEDNRPLENVNWFGATDYCTWREARLPTESEWEFAARGPDGLIYPWGNEFVSNKVVRFEGRSPDVGSKPSGASWVGALDMSGSLFEWTGSIYQSYPYDANDGREASRGVDDFSDRVFRGSAWYHPEGMHDNLSTTARFNAPPHYAAWYYGFRCVRPLEP